MYGTLPRRSTWLWPHAWIWSVPAPPKIANAVLAAALQARRASWALYLSSTASAMTRKPPRIRRGPPLGPLLSQYFGPPVRKLSWGTPAPVSGPCRTTLIVLFLKSMPVVLPWPGSGALGASPPVVVVPPVVVP